MHGRCSGQRMSHQWDVSSIDLEEIVERCRKKWNRGAWGEFIHTLWSTIHAMPVTLSLRPYAMTEYRPHFGGSANAWSRRCNAPRS